jgi:hypothetical protein
VVGERADDGEEHADRREPDTASRQLGLRQTSQAENEADGRREVTDLDDGIAQTGYRVDG